MKTINISQLQARRADYASLTPDAPVYVQVDTLPAGTLFNMNLEEHPDEGPALFLLGTRQPASP